MSEIISRLSVLVEARGVGKLNRDLAAADAYGRKASASMDRQASAYGRAGKQAQLSGLAAQKASGGFNAMGRAAGFAGKAAVVGAGAGLVYAIKRSSQFNQEMSRVQAATRANAQEMSGLRKQALKLGAATAYSHTEAAQAQANLAKGGLSVRQIMGGGLKSALALAAAGEMDLGQAAETTVNALKLFKLRGRDSMKVADGLAAAANATTADVEDFALALKMGGSASKMAGYSFEQTTTALAALAESGIKGSDAGTSLKSFFLNITRGTPKAQEAMDRLGLKFFNAKGEMKSLPQVSSALQKSFGKLTKEQFLQEAGTIAGSDAVRTLYALYDAGPEKLRRMQAGISANGTAAENARTKQNNLAGDTEKLQGSFDVFMASIGNKLDPTLRDATQAATKFVDELGRIATRDDIDLGQKIKLSEDAADRHLGPFIDRLEDQLGEADLAGKLGEIISKAAPVMANAAGAAAPEVVRAFFDAWRGSNVWGKLLIAGVLGHKTGAFQAFRIMGGKAGASYAAGFAPAAAAATATATTGAAATRGKTPIALPPTYEEARRTRLAQAKATGQSTGLKGTQMPVTPVIAPGYREKMRGQLKSAMPGLRAIGKATLGTSLAMGAMDAFASKGNVADRLQNAISTMSMGAVPGSEEMFEGKMAKHWAAIKAGKSANEPLWRGDINKLDESQRKVLMGAIKLRQYLNSSFGPGTRMIPAAWSNPGQAMKDIQLLRNGWSRMRDGLVKDTGSMVETSRRNLGLIRQTLGTNTAAGRDAVRMNITEATNWVKREMAAGRLSADQGARAISQVLRTHTAGAKGAVGSNMAAIATSIEDAMRRGGKVTPQARALVRQVYEIGLTAAASSGRVAPLRERLAALGNSSMPAKDKISVLRAMVKKTGDSAWGTKDQIRDLRMEIAALKSKKITVKAAIDIAASGTPGRPLDGTNYADKGGSGGPAGRSSRGWLGKSIDKGAESLVQEKIRKGEIDPFSSGAGALMGGAPGSGKASRVDAFNKYAAAAGLSITSAYRPGDPGWHGQNRARDYSNGSAPTAQMMQFARFMFTRFGSSLKELIYTPMGIGIKNGRPVSIQGFYGPDVAADHKDHVHVAMRKGGAVGGWGPGDRQPALLERGEHVTRASSVKKYGRPFMDAVNAGTLDPARVALYSKGTPKASAASLRKGSTASIWADQIRAEGIRGRMAKVVFEAMLRANTVEAGRLWGNPSGGDGGKSSGWFQMTNEKGSRAQRTDPRFAGNWFIQTAKGAYKRGISAALLAANVERPLESLRGRYGDAGYLAARGLTKGKLSSLMGQFAGTEGPGGAKKAPKLTSKQLGEIVAKEEKKAARIRAIDRELGGKGLSKKKRAALRSEKGKLAGEIAASKKKYPQGLRRGGSGLGYQDQVALADRGITLAERTTSGKQISDARVREIDKALSGKGKKRLSWKQVKRLQAERARLVADGGKSDPKGVADDARAYSIKDKLLRQRGEKINKRLGVINKALKGRLSGVNRKRLTGERTTLLQELGQISSDRSQIASSVRDLYKTDEADSSATGDTATDDALQRAIEEQTRATQELAEMVKEQVANQERTNRLLQTQGPQLLAATIEAVSGGIGGQVGLGAQIPTIAGRVADY